MMTASQILVASSTIVLANKGEVFWADVQHVEAILQGFVARGPYTMDDLCRVAGREAILHEEQGNRSRMAIWDQIAYWADYWAATVAA